MTSIVSKFSVLHSSNENKKKQLDKAIGDAVFFYALFCCSFHHLTQRLSSVLHHAILEGQGKNSIWYLTVQVPLRECSKREKSVYRTFSTKPDVVHTVPVVCSLHTVESGHCGYTLTLLLKSVEKKIDLDFSVSTGVHIPDV